MKKKYLLILFVCLASVCMAQKDSANGAGNRPKKPVDYQACISKADLAWSGKDYLTAKRFYKMASTAKPEEAYPKSQIELCDKKMSSDSWMSTDLDCPCHNGKIPKTSSSTAISIASNDSLAYSVFPGKVSSVSIDSGNHTIILIKHGKYLATYSNLAGTMVKPGDDIKEGDAIGYFIKSTGLYTLGFSIWNGKEKEDPRNYVRCKAQQ